MRTKDQAAEFLRNLEDLLPHVEDDKIVTSTAIAQAAVEADRTLDMNDLLERLPFSRKIVLRMIHERRIPALHLNGKWVISRIQFRAALERGFTLPSGRDRGAK